MTKFELEDLCAHLNERFDQRESAVEALSYCNGHFKKPILTSSFGYDSGVTIELCLKTIPQIPIVWIDTGFTHPDTYKYIKQLVLTQKINLKAYSPKYQHAFLTSVMGLDPLASDEHREAFNQMIKVEPLTRAFNELKPDLWITGIRAEETSNRKKLRSFSVAQNTIKFSPILYWTQKDVNEYKSRNSIMSPGNYFDPTKKNERDECGIHLI
ncbi:phosphoadenosine phosphosulfate reductase family protein [Microbulbifer sp. ALW1]|uniref:phosphoadenosine phosphosulfate reductase family protein n=1 Tax=Microbulbifer sp. (strain ALW1) TaxID=1516059 RepID=UPI00135A0F0F|nr:phosphoadenosine phosphosulfate reductase family protein [Microbulbifer sp. ALW1]